MSLHKGPADRLGVNYRHDEENWSDDGNVWAHHKRASQHPRFFFADTLRHVQTLFADVYRNRGDVIMRTRLQKCVKCVDIV